ncbi:erythromycin esterase family protein [Leeuwenhoekiella sp. MAR_2009_132]|uniref:erythromycin esterase family protein n=1 Tax=Leeuwenhoekiella sp. MAR_2009_132 TaxID=1392489 RepID=UPI00068DC4FF|nr:erythromycin esterase family protein [Leeuwenhoekiella sp. MAR_2009_132]
MRHLIVALLHFFSIQIYSQNANVVNWINENSIKIEDVDPDTKLSIFNENIPQKFANARIFGFGEATHHGKEFFDIKAKFFKYLVETQNVKIFIMEDSYPSESGINEWISGGTGSVETIAENFSTYIWYTKEVVNLLEWMRNYNLGKPENEQIRYYGMDIQNVKNINLELRELVKKFNIPVSEELLLIADACVEKRVEYGKKNDWADIQNPNLLKIESIVSDFQKINKLENNRDFKSLIRAIKSLINYTHYVQDSKSEIRDLGMFKSVNNIIDNETENGKVFIWAHNQHINNKEFLSYGSGLINLGRHLKDFYKDDYYSVYFDFGKGKLKGNVFKKGKPNHWEVYEIKKPFKKPMQKHLLKPRMIFTL